MFRAYNQGMRDVLFVTTNKDKFQKAKVNLESYGINVVQQPLEMTELQSESGELIVRHKAEQAFTAFQRPLLVNDDTWSVPALKGFPSTNMKTCNTYLTAEDWLRLMDGLDDRRIFLTAYFAYHDGESITVSSFEEERRFLDKPQGTNSNAPVLEVIARPGRMQSMAEEIANGLQVDEHVQRHWQALAKILS